MFKPMRLAAVIVALVAVPLGLLMGSGQLIELVYAKEIAQSQTEAKEAELEINAKARLNSHVYATWERSFVSGLSQVGVVVAFDFVPPTVDGLELQQIVRTAVTSKVHNLTTLKLAGLKSPPKR